MGDKYVKLIYVNLVLNIILILGLMFFYVSNLNSNPDYHGDVSNDVDMITNNLGIDDLEVIVISDESILEEALMNLDSAKCFDLSTEFKMINCMNMISYNIAFGIATSNNDVSFCNVLSDDFYINKCNVEYRKFVEVTGY